MTNNEIIKFLQSKQIPQCGDKEYTADEEYEAYQRAIDALEQKLEEPYLTESEKVICNIYLDDLDRQSAESENPCNEYRIIKSLINAGRKEPCDDAVSRQAVLSKKIYTETEEGWSGYTVDADYIENMPPVTPQQKYGKWIDYSDEGFVECPFCGHATNCEDNINELHYCFHCGAKMKSEGKEC